MLQMLHQSLLSLFIFPLCTYTAWFYKIFILFSRRSNRPLTAWQHSFSSFLWHLSVYICVTTAPSSVTHYPLFSLCVCCVLHLSFPLVLSLHTHTAAIYYIASLPSLLSWWNCLSAFCWLHLFFLQVRTLSCSFIAPRSPCSRLPPHISFHLSCHFASWLTYSRVELTGK